MTDPATTAPTPAAKPRRRGPNRMIIVWGRPNAGKTTFCMSLGVDAANRWRWVAHVDGDDSAASVPDMFADPAVARHYPVDLDAAAMRKAILALIPAVASGECGAAIIEGLCPLYDFYVGESFGDNPKEADAGGMHAMKLYAAPAAKVRAVHSAITRLFQAAPKDSGFVCVVTMHAKNAAGVTEAPKWRPDVSNGVWEEFWRMTPIVVELTRFGAGAPVIEWADPTNEIRRMKNSVAAAKLVEHRNAGKPLGSLPAFIDTINGAEAFQVRAARAREAAKTAAAAPPPTSETPAADLPLAA